MIYPLQMLYNRLDLNIPFYRLSILQALDLKFQNRCQYYTLDQFLPCAKLE